MPASSRPAAENPRNEWAALDRTARRRVRRAVNRGQAVTDRKEAMLAVAVASGQRRLWRFGWLYGAAMGVVIMWGQGWEAMLANAAIGALTFGLISLFFLRRAARAEAANREVAARKRHPKERDRSQRRAKGGSASRRIRKHGR